MSLPGVKPQHNLQPRPKRMPIEAPEIAVLVPRTDHWADLARHLLTPLGLPQVAVVEEGAAVASSVHSVVALGPERWAPSPAVPVWMLTTGAEPAAEGNATFALETGELVELPTEQTLTVVADGRDALGTAAAVWNRRFSGCGSGLTKAPGRSLCANIANGCWRSA